MSDQNFVSYGDAETLLTGVKGAIDNNFAKGVKGNETVLSTDKVPFISKQMGAGAYQRKKFVGCSFVWNQLVDNNTESVTIASGHKYALYKNGVWSIGASDGTAIAVTGGSDLFTDLTQLFGSTAIADYIYNLETATAGAGVAKLKEWGYCIEDYYAYNADSIQNVCVSEYDVLDENENVIASYPLTPTDLLGVPLLDANNNLYYDGDEYASDGTHSEKYDICDLGTLPWAVVNSGYNTNVRISGMKPSSNNKIAHIICPKYTAIARDSLDTGGDKLIMVNVNGSLIIHDTSLTEGMTEEQVQSYLSGVPLVYEKATPTTETLTPFDFPQAVGSIEEITDYKVEQEERDVAIPTGHVTEYMGAGGEFSLPTLPETPSVLAFDGHNFYWKTSS